MRLSKTVNQLSQMRKAMGAVTQSGAGLDRLSDLSSIADNPGKLRGRYYVPDQLPAGAPLVVVLHGCTQDAAAYDQGSGWSMLADRHGFALLFPEQTRSNNANLCFNWFSANDTQRGMGEAASIRSMVEGMVKTHGIDGNRIFVTGLSAGGAMASVMLATYPELFAAGAIIAGIAYGCASGVAEAFDCMGGRSRSDAAELAANVRRASPHKGPWPRVSVWQGSADHTVVPSNAEAIVLQWTQLHGLSREPSRTGTVEGYPHRVWEAADGTALIEQYTITGMAHGTPLMPGTEEGQSGEAMAHMLDARISSTDRIAEFFGIAPAGQAKRVDPAQAKTSTEKKPSKSVPLKPEKLPQPTNPPEAANSVQQVIEDALRAAGLMR